MAEGLRHNPSPEQAPRQPEHQAEHHRPRHEAAERQQSPAEKAESLAFLRKEVGQEAKRSGDIKLDHRSEQRNQAAPPVTRELKNMMRLRTLNRVRKELPASQRALSKVVHTKPVEAISAVGEKTIARPAGLLGGGLVALIGSAVTFYMAKHYGFRYNLLLFLMLFIAGYAAATLLEVIALLVKRLRR
jgi:hypothetical protein